MKISDSILLPGEHTLFTLRGLYASRGYAPYRMSKFEEYDLYAGNKDFLVSDNVITFTDTNGKLMALKPDVTLSIIKNTRDTDGTPRRIYYNENVYEQPLLRLTDREGYHERSFIYRRHRHYQYGHHPAAGSKR